MYKKKKQETLKGSSFTHISTFLSVFLVMECEKILKLYKGTLMRNYRVLYTQIIHEL